jgi:hypothetical protein
VRTANGHKAGSPGETCISCHRNRCPGYTLK